MGCENWWRYKSPIWIYDEIMIKDNHIDFNEDIQTTVKKQSTI